MKTKPMLTLPWIAIHVVLGFAVAQSPILAKVWNASILLIGIYQIIKNKNQNNEAALWSAYMAGADVALRACEGALLWEIGKYGVVLLLLLGLIVEQKKKAIPSQAIIMLLLLIPGAIMTFTWSNRISQDISFNLSGMLCLLISMIYFFKRPVEHESLMKVFSYSLLSIISLSVVLFYRTPSLELIDFNTQANFKTSGGFGPNQVATILGYGWLLLLILIFMKEKVTFSSILTYAILAFVVYRSLFTFSRGGNLGAILALAVFLGIYALSQRKRRAISGGFLTLVVFVALSLIIVNRLNTVTGGLFEYRFTGKNVQGEAKEDVTTGRLDILEEEFELFKESPVMGVGVGGSTYFRAIKFNNPLASHNEFGRLLSEHGTFGIIVILIMLFSPIAFCKKLPDVENRAYCMMFFVLCVASMMHSGCRTAMPEFLYGLSFIYLIPHNYDKNP